MCYLIMRAVYLGSLTGGNEDGVEREECVEMLKIHSVSYFFFFLPSCFICVYLFLEADNLM